MRCVTGLAFACALLSNEVEAQNRASPSIETARMAPDYAAETPRRRHYKRNHYRHKYRSVKKDDTSSSAPVLADTLTPTDKALRSAPPVLPELKPEPPPEAPVPVAAPVFANTVRTIPIVKPSHVNKLTQESPKVELRETTLPRLDNLTRLIIVGVFLLMFLATIAYLIPWRKLNGVLEQVRSYKAKYRRVAKERPERREPRLATMHYSRNQRLDAFASLAEQIRHADARTRSKSVVSMGTSNEDGSRIGITGRSQVLRPAKWWPERKLS